MEFPMYFSLAPKPGYNISILDSHGIDGEFNLFFGYSLNENNWYSSSTWRWGSVNHSIEGTFRSVVKTINLIFIKIFGLRAN